MVKFSLMTIRNLIFSFRKI
uniref:Uncharacterized protein n=1 Tax=Rhizophora mucronata TaxID=61149 RepID=A0A2P2QRK7_RHIMU